MRLFKRKGRTISALVLTVGMVMAVASGCTNTSAPNSEKESASGNGDTEKTAIPTKGGTIRIAIPEEPDTLDVQQSAMSMTDKISRFFGSNLVTMDPDTKELKPSLAENYTVSEDGQSITFKLRSGITFHDGTPLNAMAYKDTFDRLLDPKTMAKGIAQQLNVIESVSVTDDQTFVVHLKEPFAPFLYYLSTNAGQALSMEAVKKYGADYGRNPVGVGPWQFEEWKTGEAISFVRNDGFQWADPFYENQGPARADKLQFKIIKDKQTTIAALESGSVDIAPFVEAKDVKKLRNHPDYYVVEEVKSGLGLFVSLNTESELLVDLKVRKALNLAINKEAIIQAQLQGEGVVADGPLSPSVFGYDQAVEAYGYTYDLVEAQELLAAAGWTKNASGHLEKGGKELALRLLTDNTYSKAAQLIQAMLGEVGIDVQIETMDFATLLEKGANGDFDLALMGYTYEDPDILYLLLHSSQISGLNLSRVQDSELDALLAKGRKTIDSSERKKIYADAQKRIVEQAYWIPVYADKQFHIVNKKVQGVKVSAGLWYMHDSWVAGK
ncbi:ABC transporter substrate-binding protein [Brevibacillus sp. SIMBA_040]|uniref:ABC transporter substrate-binding protein n=1 Tax=unclassified Brevibacillus TaxID=2684853 RepID=UPI00397C1CE8